VCFENLERMVDTKPHEPNPPWTHIPEAAAAKLTATHDEWKTASTHPLAPFAPETAHEKNRVLKSAKKYLRHFINQHIRYSDNAFNFERNQAGSLQSDSGKHDSVKTRGKRTCASTRVCGRQNNLTAGKTAEEITK
jgi:hypothetical protein